MKVHYIVEIPNLGAFIKVKKAAPEDTFSGASFDTFTNGMSGTDFYKELVDGKVEALTITTPKKEKKSGKKALTDGAVDETIAKTKKSKAKKSKGEDESPLKKSKKDEAVSDAKLADEMTKLMDGNTTPVEEDEEEEGEVPRKSDGGDDEDDDGEEVTVVEETQPDELDPVLKARSKSRLGAV
jgi:hypothetical protein